MVPTQQSKWKVFWDSISRKAKHLHWIIFVFPPLFNTTPKSCKSIQPHEKAKLGILPPRGQFIAATKAINCSSQGKILYSLAKFWLGSSTVLTRLWQQIQDTAHTILQRTKSRFPLHTSPLARIILNICHLQWWSISLALHPHYTTLHPSFSRKKHSFPPHKLKKTLVKCGVVWV